MPRSLAKRSVYRREGDFTLIEINLRELRQLFNSLDPAPFLEKDLDDTAAGYIVTAVREVGLHHAAKLIIHLPAPSHAQADTAGTIEAIHHYFEYRANEARNDLRQLLLRGLSSLLIGLAFLAACLSFRQLLRAQNDIGPVWGEGLLIIGWVAMWRPIEIFLYDWWPIRHRERLLRHVSRMPIEFRPSAQ